jgi:hypothetical protein
VATLKITGEAELHRSLKTLGGDLSDLSRVNGDVARDLAAAIGARAPVATGRLAGSFTASGSHDKATASSSLDYAGPQNYGVPGHNIRGTHYAEDALASSAGDAETKYRHEAERLCRKAET